MMKRRLLIVTLLTASLFIITTVNASPEDYHPSIVPSADGFTQISWTIVEAPTLGTEWGWTGEGAWLATNGSIMTFIVQEIDMYLTGQLNIGNFSILTNNTDIARELVLGVWGLTSFFPGLIVKVGQNNLDTLNETAHASAARVQYNYLNGTMDSTYENITVGGVVYHCLVFDYQQDSSPYLISPQETHLAYDTETGILIEAETSVKVFNEYRLVLEFRAISQPLPILFIVSGSGGAILIVVVIVVLMKKR